MQIISCKDYWQLSQKAAELVKKQIEGNPETVLGLPTGSTPLGMYEQLTQLSLIHISSAWYGFWKQRNIWNTART